MKVVCIAMSYTSFLFYVLCAVVFLVYHLLPRRVRWCWLLISSAVFYALASSTTILFLAFSALTIYAGGRLIASFSDRQKAYLSQHSELSSKEKKAYRGAVKKKQRLILAGVVALNAGILLVFKFYNLTVNHLFAWFPQFFMSGGKSASLPLLTILAPIGLSFYSLQAISYIVDVYREKIPCEKNPLMLMLYLCYFPTIVQGPISRYTDLVPKFRAGGDPVDTSTVIRGLNLMLWGLLKKLIIADRLNIFVTNVFSESANYQGYFLIVGIMLYSIQIYCDFSGGIDIVSGFSRTLGIDLVKNFDHPYFSRSIPEFWRRWHITLGAWLREYIFYPISLSKPLGKVGMWARRKLNPRVGKMLPVYLSLCVVWFLNGAWHGARLQFILFGVYHGLLTMGGMLCENLFARMRNALRVRTDCFSWRFFQMVRTFLLGCVGRIIYKAPSVAAAGKMMVSVFTATNFYVLFDGSLLWLGLAQSDFVILLIACAILLCVSMAQEKISLSKWLSEQNFLFRVAVYVLTIVVLLVFGAYGPEYSAAQFIYGQY